ncbi:MAG: hypothetical protein LBI48_05970 [Burkholderiaceae bacterium]|jgi:hypothetical protein|nr:hypothetical protein [Burkholderiaceae bacterium]
MIERFLIRAFGVLARAGLILIGLVFAFFLLIWLLLMLLAGLLASLFTGRAPAVTVLWRNYRQMAGKHWPARRAPRADAAKTQVQDVSWRDVPASPSKPPDDAAGAP